MAELDTEDLKNLERQRQRQEEREPYRPRPKWQLVLAWVLIGIVLFAFLGTCYWMVNYRG